MSYCRLYNTTVYILNWCIFWAWLKSHHSPSQPESGKTLGIIHYNVSLRFLHSSIMTNLVLSFTANESITRSQLYINQASLIALRNNPVHFMVKWLNVTLTGGGHCDLWTLRRVRECRSWPPEESWSQNGQPLWPAGTVARVSPGVRRHVVWVIKGKCGL